MQLIINTRTFIYLIFTNQTAMLHPHAKTQEARKKYLERGENTQDVQAQ